MHLSDPVGELLAPTQALIGGALGPWLPARVSLGDTHGAFWERQGDALVLDAQLGTGALAADAGPHGLDRWRRAAACVLEASWFSHRAPAWRAWGDAIWAADQALPALRIADADLALARRTGTGKGRCGVAPVAAAHALGEDLDQLDDPMWRRLGGWVLGAGLGARLPDVPASKVFLLGQLEPLSWRRVNVNGGPSGCFIEGPVDRAWVPAETEALAFAGALRGGRLSMAPGVPLGTWRLASLDAMGQVMGARGITWTFKADGTVELLLSDSFVGPVGSVDVADQVGTSGVINARWAITGPWRFRIESVVPMGLTVHEVSGRSAPAHVGPESWVRRLEGVELRWSQEGVLILRGEIYGGPMRLRLRPAG
jgi:hypothetical protein